MRRSLFLARKSLRADKPFAATAMTTFALGIAAATVMFSVTNGVLLRPLPYPEPDRIVRLSEHHADSSRSLIRDPVLSNLTYYAWNGRSQTIGPIGVFSSGPSTVGFEEPLRMLGAWVSGAIFDVLRVRPALGRLFTDADGAEAAPPVVILSEGLWRERFGGDPAAIGKTLSINRVSHTIVGVVPRGFTFPDADVRFWLPNEVPSTIDANGKARLRHASALARLLPGVSAEQAAAEGLAIAQRQPFPAGPQEFSGSGAPVEMRVVPLARAVTAAVRPAILLVLAGAGCLLLIACANVANLLLSRGAARERELAVMQAIGAGRARVMVQLMIESVLLALPGGAAGIALAWLLIRALPAVAPVDFPRLIDVRFDWTVAAFAVAVALMAGLVSGWLPAIRSARLDLVNSLRAGMGTSAARHTARSRRTLLIAEASLAMLLLALATIIGRGFVRLIQVNPGYDATQVLTARIFLPGEILKRGEPDQFAAALLERLRGVPGVKAAGAGWMSPFGGSTSATTFTIGPPGGTKVTARSLVNVVTPGYADALRLQLRSGRLLTDADLSWGRQALVVNEEFVRTFLRGVQPVGVNVGVILSRGVEAEIVGVVANVLKDGRQSLPQPEVSVVAAHRYTVGGEFKLVARTDGDLPALGALLRQFVRELRKDAAVDNVLPLSQQLSDSVRTERLAIATMGTLATLALTLAAVGLYGVLSYSVSTRKREIGIRAALGAGRADVIRLIVRDGMTVAAIGLLVGLIAAVSASRLLEAQFYGVRATDPVPLFAALFALAAVAFVACLIPAQRAAAIDPATALRAN